ncbi:hypothetical protein HN784_02775 [bacterium]|jgi:membrane-bound metal-dependent hydrolase YbcI (DUF457 family)|nr:hypothetical protein [bacterium]MBT4250819.1 hypothetical protein [bacterium]MBT4597531.1 hypothetical protein [bacterium]MBT6753997.1 hypothetical protein [bacterium]MBT7037545.1 hypothetical protein [bacterium]
MANFKTHISWGVILGISFIVACMIYSVSLGFEMIAWIFLATLLGSFSPDLDVDEGIPFKIVFGLLAMSLSGYGFFYLFQQEDPEMKFLIGFPIAIFVAIRFVAGYIFMQLTHHRGIFHSLPAALVFGLLAMWVLKVLKVDNQSNFLISSAIFVGYIGHLTLDEIYSSISFDNLRFRSKKSLGSAMKLYSSSQIATFLIYFMLVTLIFVLYQMKMFA